MVRKIILSLIIFVALFFTSTVYAADDPPAGRQEFGTSYDVVYDVGEDGVTTVTEKVTLKNLTSQYYASQFKLIIGATQISDIKASDGSGSMEVKSEQKDTSTTINVKFNAQVAGLNKTLPWTLQFKSKDFAEKTGKVWEVRAPKVSTTNNVENYNLTMRKGTIYFVVVLYSLIRRHQFTWSATDGSRFAVTSLHRLAINQSLLAIARGPFCVCFFSHQLDHDDCYGWHGCSF